MLKSHIKCVYFIARRAPSLTSVFYTWLYKKNTFLIEFYKYLTDNKSKLLSIKLLDSFDGP